MYILHYIALKNERIFGQLVADCSKFDLGVAEYLRLKLKL